MGQRDEFLAGPVPTGRKGMTANPHKQCEYQIAARASTPYTETKSGLAGVIRYPLPTVGKPL